MLERVLTKGVILQPHESAVEAEEGVVWVHVTIAGVDVFNVEAGLSWRYLVGAADDDKKK